MAICNAVGLFLLVDGVLVGLAGVTAPPFGNVVCREHGGDPERREGGGNGEARYSHAICVYMIEVGGEACDILRTLPNGAQRIVPARVVSIGVKILRTWCSTLFRMYPNIY